MMKPVSVVFRPALTLSLALLLWAPARLAAQAPHPAPGSQDPPPWSVPELEAEPPVPASGPFHPPPNYHGRHYASLPQGLGLLVRQRLWVTRGRLLAPLPTEVLVEGLQKVTLSGDKQKAEVQYVDFCLGLHKVSYPLTALKARLANEAGLAHFRSGQLPAAEDNFRRALQLDPGLQQAALNLAATLMRRNQPDGALAALARFSRQNPDDIYLNLLVDPLLRPLLDRPQIRALRSKHPGRAVLSYPLLLWGRNDLFSGYHLALRGDHAAIAVIHRQVAWGTSNWHCTLQILSLPGLRLLTQLQLVLPYETHPRTGKVRRGARATIQQRLELANRFLAARGFAVPAGLQRAKVESQDHSWQATFPHSLFTLSIMEHRATVSNRQSKLLTREVPRLKRLEWASYLPSLKLVAYGWSRAAREGCEGFDPEGVELLSPSITKLSEDRGQRRPGGT